MGVLVGKEIRQAWRSFRLPALFLVSLFLAIMDPLTARYMGEILARLAQGVTIVVPPPSPGQAVAQYLGDIVEIGLLVVIAITMGSVANEKASGVTTFVVTRPASRRSYVAAKFVVLAGGVMAAIIAGTLVAGLYTWTLLGAPEWGRVGLAALSVALYVWLVFSATFAASMVAGSGLAAGGLGLATMIVMGAAGAVLGGTEVGRYLPSVLVGNVQFLLAGTGDVDIWARLVRPGITALVLSAVLLLLGYGRFRRQPLP